MEKEEDIGQSFPSPPLCGVAMAGWGRAGEGRQGRGKLEATRNLGAQAANLKGSSRRPPSTTARHEEAPARWVAATALDEW
jgi:hypothetical protein